VGRKRVDIQTAEDVLVGRLPIRAAVAPSSTKGRDAGAGIVTPVDGI
jgi:hypothetical protein